MTAVSAVALSLVSGTLLSVGLGGIVEHAAPTAPDGRIRNWSALGTGTDNYVWSLALGTNGTRYAGVQVWAC